MGVKRNEEKNEERINKRTTGKPDDVCAQVWEDWLAHRAGGSMTESALIALRKEAIKAGMSLELALIEAMARNWKGFKASWMQQSARSTDTKQRTAAAIFDFPRACEG
jgi:hypothetical protein